ncbi:MAG TPA: gliding motility-associated protein GldE [Chitinophagales bacterium]|nr:gliding motility-associated protein GldE [Chitinophagales bacterium]
MDDPVSTNFIFLQALVNAPTTGVFVANLIIVVLIACSAVMSASEIAFFSLSNAEVDSLRESEDAIDNRVAKLLDRPRYLLSSILIANNLVNIGVVVTSYYVTKLMFNFHDYQIGSFILHDYVIEFLWNVIVVTFMLVLFGEATPKVYATQNKLPIARSMSNVFVWMVRAFEPINYVLVGSTKVLEKRLKRYNAEIDIDEINKAIEITVEKKESKHDASLLKGIVHFGNIMVKQAMRPRTEVVSVDYDFTFKELVEFIKENGYSRYPVYKENRDNVVGVLNIKDLIEHLNQDNDFGWQKLVREPFFVPETKKIDDLLREIQQNRKHLAVVVDEYGGTCGIITLEDIMEEVVGDITDEFDEAIDSGFKKLDDKNFLFDGKTQLSDVCRLMEIDLTTFEDVKGESETMAGLILETTGRIPKNGEEIKLLSYRITVISVVHNRIEKVKITNEA